MTTTRTDVPGPAVDHGRLPATAYAILGLLERHHPAHIDVVPSFTARYGTCWPRTDALIYEQTRRLIALGHATTVGRRGSRHVGITASGRRALREWLAETSAPPRLELEAALRLVVLDPAADAERQRTVAELGGWARHHLAALGAAEGTTDAPVAELLRDLYGTIVAWATRHADT